jgi:hypothetical protein
MSPRFAHARHPIAPRRRGRSIAGVLTVAVAACAAAAPAAAQTAPAGVICVPASPAYGPSYGPGVPSYGIANGAGAPSGDVSKVKLSRGQMITNQRISQAAIRRVDAVQKWIDSGVVATDICGGALGPEDFTGITPGTGPTGTTPTAPTPRKLVFTAAGPGDPSSIKLSRAQFLINQRIAQAAVRRSTALRARFITGLTGGDVVDGTLGTNTLRIGFTITAATPASPPPAASATVITGSPSGDPSKVKLSKGQLLIEQRISQAGVRRSNALIAHVRTGLNGNDFRNGGLTAVDLGTGVVR